MAGLARAFAARVTDPSRQRSTVKEPPPKRHSFQDPLKVPEVTVEQQEAAAAKQKADDALAAASKAASDAAAVCAALKKVADDYMAVKKKADQEVLAAKAEADKAAVAKRDADVRAIDVLKQNQEKEKRFLKNAFETFDTNKAGFLTPDQITIVLRSCKLPSDIGDVDDLVQVLDISKDEVIQQWEWVGHMPVDLRQALRNHPQANEWAVE